MESVYKKYIRSNEAEMRPVDEGDIYVFERDGKITLPNIGKDKGLVIEVSISESDRKNGSPRIGDMIARNPENYSDQWLVGEEYFKKNFKEK